LTGNIGPRLLGRRGAAPRPSGGRGRRTSAPEVTMASRETGGDLARTRNSARLWTSSLTGPSQLRHSAGYSPDFAPAHVAMTVPGGGVKSTRVIRSLGSHGDGRTSAR